MKHNVKNLLLGTAVSCVSNVLQYCVNCHTMFNKIFHKRTQSDQMAVLFFNILPYRTTKNCPKV